MKKILITGSSGFIGSNLTQALHDGKYRVFGVDLRPPRFYPPDEFMPLDIRDQKRMEQILRDIKPDCILHLAAVSTIQKGVSDPDSTWDVNVNGTHAVLNAVEASGLKPNIVYVSTDKVYGPMPGNTGKYTEDMPIQPLRNSPYDSSKAEADRLAQSFFPRLPVTILRLCNIYGPYDANLERIVPANVHAMLAGRPGRLNRYRDKTGLIHNFYRDMLYVGDSCTAFSLLLKALETDVGRFSGQVFNIGAPECLSMEQVLSEIQRVIGCDLPSEISLVEADIELNSQSMDSEKARKYLGFSPATGFAAGIQKTVGWWRANSAAPGAPSFPVNHHTEVNRFDSIK